MSGANPINPFDCAACRSVRQEAIRSHRRMQDQHGVLLKVQKSRDEWRERALKAEGDSRRVDAIDKHAGEIEWYYENGKHQKWLEWSWGNDEHVREAIDAAMADDEGGG